jgi:hypothetical protein
LNPKNGRLEIYEGFMYVLAKFHIFGAAIPVSPKAAIVIAGVSSKKAYRNMLEVRKVLLKALEP